MSRCLKLFCKTTQKEYHGQFKERCGHHYFDENLCFCNKCVTQLQFDTITQLRRSRLSEKPNNHKNENVSSAIALNIKKGVFQAQINCCGLHAIGIACLLAHFDYKELHTETNELKCIASDKHVQFYFPSHEYPDNSDYDDTMYCCSRRCHSHYYLCNNGEVSIVSSL